MRYLLLFLLSLVFMTCTLAPVGTEVDGYVFVEAEDYKYRQAKAARKWTTIKAGKKTPKRLTDPDPNHAATASGGTYLEALPDTRVTHDDELVHSINFSNEPGKVATLGYPIRFQTPGRYYVWVRAYSTGTEDNGIHVGLNGEWPASGRRMQWCEGKNQWTWASKQRTEEQHCGVERLIYLDVHSAGIHTVNFSMREDGFEFDAFVLRKEYVIPEDGA